MKPIAILACAGLLSSCGMIRSHLHLHRDHPSQARTAAQTAVPARRPAPRPDTALASAQPSAPAPSRTSAPAEASAGTGTPLGTTVANLGSPSRPGLWLETPLVAVPRKGRIEAGGKSATVDLLPLDAPKGTGSQMSLGAYRALGLSLTALPEITVFAR